VERIIPMSTEEIKRTTVFSKLQARALIQQQAAADLDLSIRQVRRLFKAYSTHQLPRGVKELVLAIIREKYPDFGPTLAHEKIMDVHNIKKISVWSFRCLTPTLSELF
jgi:hypothetical protein